MGIRELVLEVLDTLSQPSTQLRYEELLVNAGHAPTELVSVFCDDLFDPKDDKFVSAFSGGELKGLAHLYGLLVETSGSQYQDVTAMLKDAKWRRVIHVAQQLSGGIRNAR